MIPGVEREVRGKEQHRKTKEKELFLQDKSREGEENYGIRIRNLHLVCGSRIGRANLSVRPSVSVMHMI